MFDLILFDSKLECRPIDLEILERAASIRVSHRLKTPDAIHAATAFHLGAVSFVTNDRGFLRVPDLNVVILDDVVSTESENESS